MFDVISWGLVTAFLMGSGEEQPPLSPVQQLAWQELALFSLPHPPQPMIEETIQNYLQDLSLLGISALSQGVWFASDWWTFADHRGNIPQSAASLTKIATSLAALEVYGVDYQFKTRVKQRGTIQDGVLVGDLIIEGGGDPFFVWEEAIALGNRLNELGIEKVQGNLIVTGDFFMNYQSSSQLTAQLLAQALNVQLWSREIQQQHQQLSPETPRPKVVILGEIIFQNEPIAADKLIILHQSLPLTDILHQMNIYSNNKMSDLIANSMGGAKKVAEIVINLTGVSPQEVQLINGSGLGMENRISPRAVVKMLQVMQRKLLENGYTIADVLPVGGIETGTVRDRAIPKGIPVKTGSLWNVSALAGVINTDRQGLVYFAIINQNGNLSTFRNQQDQLLQNLEQQWNFQPFLNQSYVYLGDPKRNI